MSLVAMVATDKDAIICDFAETYGIYDIWSFEVDYIATLADGLREDSRIKMKMAGMKVDLNTMLVSAAVDRLSMLLWVQSEDGQKNRNRPKSIAAELIETTDSQVGFETSEEFEAARERIMKG